MSTHDAFEPILNFKYKIGYNKYYIHLHYFHLTKNLTTF